MRQKIFSDSGVEASSAAAVDDKNTSAAGDAVWTGKGKTPPEDLIIAYCAGRDVQPRPPADEVLIPYDLWTNAAHVAMLHKQEIISPEHAAKIFDGLTQVEGLYTAGEFKLNPALEDVHINIESKVGELAGKDAAGRMHTGRSRNDQAACDMRLWLRDHAIEMAGRVLQLVATLTEKADAWSAIPTPGYTHQQPGMISSLGYWAAHHAQALLRDAQRFVDYLNRNDSCPLGAAAGYGTSWPLDREYTARLLGFARVQAIGLDAVTNRWEAEADLVTALQFMMSHLSILSQDIIYYTSSAAPILNLPARFTTGSSIMPQKRNPDFAEVTRGKAAHIQGHLNSLLTQAKAMLSGYNRDSQWSKYAVLDAVDEARDAPLVMKHVLTDIEPNEENSQAACAVGFLNAVEVADHLSRKAGLDFRSCYKVMGQAVESCRKGGELTREAVQAALADNNIDYTLEETDWATLSDPIKLLSTRQTSGSAAPDQAKAVAQDIVATGKKLSQQINKFEERKSDAISELREVVENVSI
jgi:argininosuccinate lyase